jgi:chemotaxis protein methyltransferase CheR
VLDEVISQRFGMSISCYPRALIERLLEVLPEPAVVRGGDADALLRQHLSIGETHFLRHRDQFDVLCQIAPGLPGPASGGALSVWSAACSTGEEVWTLAAALRATPGLGGRFSVLGTDFNPESIRKAEEGRYRSWSMRGLALDEVAEWLWAEGDLYAVDPALQAHTRFQVGNLMDGGYPGSQDVIFCRNVLIYFRPDAIKKVYQGLFAALKPGGVLFVAATDPQPDPGMGFESVDAGGARYFRRPDGARPAVARPAAPAPAPVVARPAAAPARPAGSVARPAPRPAPAAAPRCAPPAPLPAAEAGSGPAATIASRWSALRGQVAQDALSAADQGRRAAGLCPAPSPAAPLPELPEALAAHLYGMASAGKLHEAIAHAADAVDAHPMDLGLRCAAAWLAAEGGLVEVASVHARQALFLQPDAPVPNLLVGALLIRQGQRGAYAQQRLVRAQAALAALPPDAQPPLSGGRTTETLLAIVREPHDPKHFARA